MDSNLLKEAIADAKAVRRTALANAKVALEEAFSERYQAMFAEKLKEDAEEGTSQTAAPDASPVSDTEIDDLIKELESEAGETHPEPDGDETAPVPPAAPMGGEVPPVGASAPAPTVPPGCPQCPTCAQPMTGAPVGGEVPPAGVTPPVAPTVPGATAPAPVAGTPAPATPPSDVPPVSGEDVDEDVNLDELLESLREEIECDDDDDDDEKIDEQKKLASSAIGGNKAGGSDNKKPSGSASSSSGIESGGMKQEGMPSPDGTKVGPADATSASRPNKGNNATSTNLSTPSNGGSSGPALKASRPNSKGDFENTPSLQENADLKKQLNEAEEVIKYVKGQLNEVNLLNAKLLYTNKLFKEFAMNNEHKLRIVEMFDLAKNVREVKLTYANIAESLNFGGNEQKKKVVATTNSSVQSITEGLSSKPVGSTKPKEIISEGTFATRMKQLAGIRSEQKK